MKKESRLTDLMALMVLLVFALCILLVLLTGTRVYQRLLDKGEESFTSRMSVRYITTRIHQGRSLAIGDFDGCPALILPEEIDGEKYQTLVYWYDGCIRELFCADSSGLEPEDGEKIMETPPLSFHTRGDLLAVDIGADRVYLNLPGEKEIPL